MTALASHSRLASWVLFRLDTLMALNAQYEIRLSGFGHPGFQRALRLTERILARLRATLPATVKLYAFSADRQDPFTAALDARLMQQGIALIDGVADAVEAARLRGEPVLAADGGHWAPSGHRIAANIIGAKLLADLHSK